MSRRNEILPVLNVERETGASARTAFEVEYSIKDGWRDQTLTTLLMFDYASAKTLPQGKGHGEGGHT